MSKTRWATFPLDCDALKAANKAAYKTLEEDGKKPRRLTMEPGDYKYRKAWMDAYIKAGGKYEYRKPKREPGTPLTTCGDKPPEPHPTANLTITVRDSRGGLGVPGVDVTLKGPKGFERTRKTNPDGYASFNCIDAGDYEINTKHRDYRDAASITHVNPSETNVDEIKIEYKWKKMGFWVEAYVGDLWFYKKLRGFFCARKHGSADKTWYAWRLSTSLVCASVPIKGKPPIGVGSFKTFEQTILYDPELIEPTRDWVKKGVWVRLAGEYLWVKIKNAVPRTPTRDYEPIRDLKSTDLVLRFKTDALEFGWCTGLGGIEDMGKLKPKPPPLPALPGGGDWA